MLYAHAAAFSGRPQEVATLSEWLPRHEAIALIGSSLHQGIVSQAAWDAATVTASPWRLCRLEVRS